MKPDFSEIIRHFKFEGKFIEAVPFGSGHINDTYAASYKKSDGETRRYILQRINNKVFTEPEKLMENIAGVTSHIRKKLISEGGDPERETLNIIPTEDGKSFYRSEAGEYWRGYVFIENARTYDIVENASHFYNGGKAFGRFQKLLSDYPADKLYETIPDFHNTVKRFDAFVKTVEKDTVNRASDAVNEIEFVFKRMEDTFILNNLYKNGELPLRVTHNDTKFNNVMIDDISGEGICVVDLDTVMPGLSLYDFGDSIRSGANPAAEDEMDLSKVEIDLKLFEYFTHGFLDSARGFLTDTEIEYLPFAAKIMTFECGMRFLTDYLSGDTYFKIHRASHNMDRARTQFKMVTDMERKFDLMKSIVMKYSK